MVPFHVTKLRSLGYDPTLFAAISLPFSMETFSNTSFGDVVLCWFSMTLWYLHLVGSVVPVL